MKKEFTNGFTSWMETHHEVVSFISIITNHIDDLNPNEDCTIERLYDKQGTQGLYKLAETWTDEFEMEYRGIDWLNSDLDFWETIEKWLSEKRFE